MTEKDWSRKDRNLNINRLKTKKHCPLRQGNIIWTTNTSFPGCRFNRLSQAQYFQGRPERRTGGQVLQQPRPGRPLPDRAERGRHRRLPAGRGGAGAAGGAHEAGGLGHAAVLPVRRAGLPEEEEERGGRGEAEDSMNCVPVFYSSVFNTDLICFRSKHRVGRF